MITFVLDIIVIELCSAGGFPLEEASEHCFLSIKVLFWCCGLIYCAIPLLFSAIFLFYAIIIDLVPNRFIFLFLGLCKEFILFCWFFLVSRLIL